MIVKVISDKVSYKKEYRYLQFVILGKIESWKEALLGAWFLAWIFIGVVVMYTYFQATDREMRMMLIIFLIFWSYYFWKVGRVWLFRRGGNELIRIQGEILVLKRSFYTYGKTKTYYIEMIQDFAPVELSKSSFAYTYENGWWVLGGEKLGFSYQGKFVKFGMQLSDPDTMQVFKLIRQELAKPRAAKL